jgi:short-subunit dehydrogenase
MKCKGVAVTIAMPGSVNTDLRASALDKDMIPQKAKRNETGLDPKYVAQRIIGAADNNEQEVYLPWYYRYAAALRYFVPYYTDSIAAKKYGFKY